ncbi:zinc ABC transporter substrate-binding protein ZnuA [Vibrio hippocampi]|uniref:High-affinity zinc uptake system protein ZnuA n=1 Tax=Vibrio hippocampi TaxID=654686 RepID=A0ABM8ZFN9_9VIBR|nr:zinc ABC transporter substrate-binding protein ZnuA [Vibrio hippocampi]CAH0525118.1 High-affinity zinc uptake system protein ZnuA [Vibrio hippocampi]
MRRTMTLILMTAWYSVSAQALEVLNSIKPFEMITEELVLDAQSNSSLLATNASPHDYALKPSDIKRIDSSDLVIWFGPDLEGFLQKSLADKNKVLTIQDIEGVSLREFGSEEAHHDHDGHNHGSHDPHVWLGPEVSGQVAAAITAKLIQLDPSNQSAYEAKLAQFQSNLANKEAEIVAQLAPVKDEGYYVFHDAYAYFEHHFGLNNLGHFTVSPERRPGAKTLIGIKKTLRNDNVKCVFSEPQYTPAVVETVVRGTDTRIGQLDPLGTDIKVAKGSYFQFLQTIADSYTNCLGQ